MGNKNIGGDFSLLSILPFVGSKGSFFPESAGGRQCTMFESGSDAICALLLAHLENKKHEASIWFPAHFCGLTLSRIRNVLLNYGCTSPLKLYESAEDLEQQSFQSGDAIIWLHFNRFVPVPLSIAEQLRKQNVFVIEDFVLAPFDIHQVTGDAAVNSLRKISPLSLSLAYSFHTLPRYEISPSYGDERRIGAWKKSVFEINPDAPLESSFLERFHHAESILESRVTIHTPSLEDEWLFKIIDWEKIRESRKRNYAFLLEQLQSFGSIILPGEYQFLMLDLNQRDKIRKALFANKIFPPIHWADAPSALSARQLSIPIDQRYDESDMRTLATHLSKILEEHAA